MIELNKIYNEECIEGMKKIPDGSVDMVLCDLPYGTTACSWDVIIPFKKLWEQYNRVTKKHGAIVLFSSQPFTSQLVSSNLKNYKYDWIWDKKSVSNPQLAKFQPLKNFEVISVFGNGTTAIACLNTERNFIGFETNKEYYDKSIERIKNNVTQLDLFGEDK